jgi:hypothetical protein
MEIISVCFENYTVECRQLQGGDCEIGNCAVVVTRQKPINSNRGMVFSAWSAKQQFNINRGTMFYVWSMPRCYKQDN